MAGKAETKKVYGDFQTPPPLAEAAIAALQRLEIKPGSVLEPTCGKGAFLLAAFQAFPEAARFIGVDINAEYLQNCDSRVLLSPDKTPFNCGAKIFSPLIGKRC